MGIDINNTDKPIETTDNSQARKPEFSDELNDFLQKIKKNKDEIEVFLQGNENQELKNKLESFLKSQNPEDKTRQNTLKVKLMTCNPKDIKSIIAEYVGYKIGNPEPVKPTEPKIGISLNAMNQADTDTNQAEEDDKKAEEDDKKAEEDDKKAEEKEEKVEEKKGITEEKEEKVEEKKGITEEKEEKKEEKKEKTEEKEEIKIEDKEDEKAAEKIIEEAKEYRKNLAKSHTDLEAKTGPGSEKYEYVKEQLREKGILKNLEKSNRSEQFIIDYITIQATLQEIENNPSYTKEEISTFDKMVKNLNNACKIPDTNLSSFNEKNISQTRTELFDKEVGNESLRKTKESNMESDAHQEKYKEMFPEIGNDEMLKKYGRFLQGDSKVFWLQYETNTETRNKVRDAQENPTEENRQILESYNKMYEEILKIKDDYDTKTKDMVEDLCIISQIKGMYRCMGEGDNFTLNKAKEIESDKGILTLRGHIDGIDFAIRQDTTKASPLQTSSKLAKEKESTDDNNKNNNFIIGGTDKFVDSNYKLPSQDEIFSSITDTIMSDSSLDSAANQEEYFEDLQKKIMGNIDEKYNDTDLVHNYMRGQVKGEKIIDKTIGLMKDIRGVDPESTVSSTSPKLYNFLNVMNHNVRHSNEAEKDRLYKIMDKIDNMAKLSKLNPNTSELVNHENKFGKYFKGVSFLNTKNMLDGKAVQGETAFDLFEKYKLDSDSRNNGELYMINVEQLYNDLITAETSNMEIKKKQEDNEDLSAMENFFDGKTSEYVPPKNNTMA